MERGLLLAVHDDSLSRTDLLLRLIMFYRCGLGLSAGWAAEFTSHKLAWIVIWLIHGFLIGLPSNCTDLATY